MSTNETAPVRAGMVGLTGYGKTILNAIRRVPESVQLLAGCDASETARSAFAAETSLPVVADYADLLADPRIEAVFFVTPNALHEEMVTRAAAAGKHVFVEKPIAMNVAQARAMIAACRDAGVTLAVGHNTRRAPGHRAMKRMLDEGRLGTVVMAEANFSHAGGMALTGREWRASRELCPLCPLTQLGVHHADTLQYLLGDVVEVSAMAAHVATPADIDDSVVTVLRFASGPLGTLNSNYATPESFFIRLHGTEGLAHCDHGSHLLFRPRGSRDWRTVSVTPVETQVEEVVDFARCVRTGETPETDGAAGLKAQAVLDAAISSVVQGGRAVATERA